MDIFDLCAAGSALVLEEIGGIFSLALTIMIFIACTIRYGIKIYKYFKDKKLTPEELEQLEKDTDELIDAANDAADKINKKE